MKKRSYEEMTHIYGRIWILSALGNLSFLTRSSPVSIMGTTGMETGSSRTSRGGADLLTVGLIEVLTFVPMRLERQALLSGVCHRQPDELKSSGGADCDGKCRNETGNG